MIIFTSFSYTKVTLGEKKKSEFKAETGKEKELEIYWFKRAYQNPLGIAEAHQPDKN